MLKIFGGYDFSQDPLLFLVQLCGPFLIEISLLDFLLHELDLLALAIKVAGLGRPGLVLGLADLELVLQVAFKILEVHRYVFKEIQLF